MNILSLNNSTIRKNAKVFEATSEACIIQVRHNEKQDKYVAQPCLGKHNTLDFLADHSLAVFYALCLPRCRSTTYSYIDLYYS